MGDRASASGLFSHSCVCTCVVVATWLIVTLLVDPRGEFMVNDDWSYVRAMETVLKEGRVGQLTGWGPDWAPGGPSLVAHLIWGWLFTLLPGFSLTALRLSVLVAGCITCLVVLHRLRSSGRAGGTALFATLSLALNPLFLALSLTFMTDVTFSLFLVLSLAAFSRWRTSAGATLWLACGLAAGLAATLVRQIGLVAMVAFVVVCLQDGRLSFRLKRQAVLGALLGVVVPWLAFELVMYQTGRNTILDHQVISGVWRELTTNGFASYLELVASRFAKNMLLLGFFLSPLWMLIHWRRLRGHRVFRNGLWLLTASLIAAEGLFLGGILDSSVPFPGNVIQDFYIGPVLLKDVYVLRVAGYPQIPVAASYILAWWACVGALGLLVLSGPRPVPEKGGGSGVWHSAESAFHARLYWTAAAVYVAIISFTAFQDRYLVPTLALGVLWLGSESGTEVTEEAQRVRPALAGLLAGCIGVFAVAGVHDFMEFKRAQARCHDFLTGELGAKPCDMDGGMEFNGYHCFRPDFKPIKGLSWWWVQREDYLVTLGLLPGYRMVKEFPFNRWLALPAAVLCLQPERPGDRK